MILAVYYGKVAYDYICSKIKNVMSESERGKFESPKKINIIPPELTYSSFFRLNMDKIRDGKKTGTVLSGKLINGPIEVGKPIIFENCNSTRVVEITQSGNVYHIRTESGSEYVFDPSTTIKLPRVGD